MIWAVAVSFVTGIGLAFIGFIAGVSTGFRRGFAEGSEDMARRVMRIHQKHLSVPPGSLQ